MQLIDTKSPKSLETLQANASGNVIYGAGKIGELTTEACEKLRIQIDALCDNSPAKQGTTLRGIPIISPEKAAERYPSGNFILALTDPVGLAGAAWKLKELGIDKCLGVQFIESVLDDSDLLKNVLRVHDSIAVGGKELIFTVGMHITDQCTLKCADCGSFIPFVKHPKFTPTTTVLENIDTVCKCADEIICMSFLGGEPLLHPDWDKIIGHAAAQEKVRSISLITNGTILPRDDQWASLAHDKVTVSVSDYEGLSTKAHAFIERSDTLGIHNLYTKWTDWYAFMATGKQGLDAKALRTHFLNCWFNNCTVVSNNRMYRCGTMLNGMKAGLFPDNPENSLELNAPKNQEAVLETRAKIRDYLFEQTLFPACDYCTGGGSNRKIVPAAIQAAKQS